MYNERKDSFSIKDVVLQILFVVLFIFILMWLFPSKSFVKDALEPLYDRIFNENILMMKDSAKSYYTTPRLPQKVGDKVSMTLGDMLDKKIILPFKDSKGRSCSNSDSYVQITKMDEEYIMKVNLKCTEQENYLLVYMGCYDYCETTICEKDEKDVKTPTILPTRKDPVNPGRPTPTPVTPGKPTPKPVDPEKPKEYICKYVKTVDADYTPWGNWSGWSTNVKYKDDLTKVETKDETTYTDKKIHVGDKVVNKPIYATKQVQIGTQEQKVCTATTIIKVGTGVYEYGDWKNTGIEKSFPSDPPMSLTEGWSFVRTTSTSCGDCLFGRYKVYRKYIRDRYEVTENRSVCTKWDVKQVPKYKTVTYIKGYETKREPIYEIVKVPHTTKYYRYRTRSLIDGWRDEKWSKCDDKNLIEDGYKWTGEKKEK